MVSKFTNLFNGFFDSEKVAGLLLLMCTVISLIISNSDRGVNYVHLMHTKLDASFAFLHLNYSVEHWVNDGLMAIFFLLVGLEVEREIYSGELSSFKNAILPIAAAFGGMLIPAAIHYILNKGTTTQAGFAIPMATDIAFALGMLALAGNRVPTSVKVFLTALAIIDDIGAVLIIAFFYTKTVYLSYFGAAIFIFILLLIGNRMRIRSLVFYLLPGVAMWYCFLQSGVHATIAGVLLAFAIPFHEKDEYNISYRLQHYLHKPVAFFIVPVFALVNTAVPLPGSVVSALSSANSMGIIVGLYLGKAAGIFLFPLLLVKAGKATLQAGITWKALAGIGFLGGIGFTMSMFITNLAFEDPKTIAYSKLSILVASGVASATGLLIFLSSSKEENTDQ